jgi:hypothetical protein
MFKGRELWDKVAHVDPTYTKPISGRDFSGDTVNLTYTTMKLTEALGPAGDAWGWEVMDERVYEYGSHEQKNFTSVHSVRVRLWRKREDGTIGHIEDYGTTKIAYYAGKDQSKYLKVDEEFAKKSISDAKSKLFVALGGSAQVWLGHFDRTQHKYMDRDDDRQARAPRLAAPPPDRGDSDGDRLARASRPVAPAALPPDRDSTPTFMLSGDPVSAEDWVQNAVAIAKELTPSKLTMWWEEHKGERAKMRRRRPDMNATLDKLKAKVLAKCETFNGTGGIGHVSPDQALRAG